MKNPKHWLISALLLVLSHNSYGQIPEELEPIDWEQFDYKPGNQLLFFDDFTADRAGERPVAWNIPEDAKVDVVESDKRLWLHALDVATVSPQNVRLGGQFTVEMDFYYMEDRYSGRYRIDLNSAVPEDWASFTIEPPSFFFSRSTGLTSEKLLALKTGIHHVAIAVDGGGFKCYIDNRRLINIPKTGDFAAVKLEIYMPGADEEIADDDKCQFTNFTIMQGPAPLRTQLNLSGKVVSYGILFTPGQPTIKPESTPTLKELAELLEADASLSVAIECHDNELEDAGANRRLSQARAEAIKDHLVETYKIHQNRLSTEGWGEGKPLGEPDTVDGRRMNQRVEILRK